MGPSAEPLASAFVPTTSGDPGELAGNAARDRIATLRRFHRFILTRLAPLRRNPLQHGLDHWELRVYREIGDTEWGSTAVWMAWRLKMHPSRICRMLSKFRAHRLIEEVTEDHDRRVKRITLTRRGRDLYQSLERTANESAWRELSRLSTARQGQLIEAMDTIEEILGNPERPIAPAR